MSVRPQALDVSLCALSEGVVRALPRALPQLLTFRARDNQFNYSQPFHLQGKFLYLFPCISTLLPHDASSHSASGPGS